MSTETELFLTDFIFPVIEKPAFSLVYRTYIIIKIFRVDRHGPRFSNRFPAYTYLPADASQTIDNAFDLR